MLSMAKKYCCYYGYMYVPVVLYYKYVSIKGDTLDRITSSLSELKHNPDLKAMANSIT